MSKAYKIIFTILVLLNWVVFIRNINIINFTLAVFTTNIYVLLLLAERARDR